MTHEEQAINALPPYLQRRMAMLCLAGWRFEHSRNRARDWWAWKLSEPPPSKPFQTRCAYTLEGLLDRMDIEYNHERYPLPDAASP